MTSTPSQCYAILYSLRNVVLRKNHQISLFSTATSDNSRPLLGSSLRPFRQKPHQKPFVNPSRVRSLTASSSSRPWFNVHVSFASSKSRVTAILGPLPYTGVNRPDRPRLGGGASAGVRAHARSRMSTFFFLSAAGTILRSADH